MNIILTNVLPITINKVTDDVVSVKGVVSSLSTLNVRLNTFWEMLMRRGGTWMWDYVSNRSNNTGWLMTALQQGSAVLATDGSYSRIRGPTVCGAGWVFACCRSRRILCGSFYEFSTKCKCLPRGTVRTGSPPYLSPSHLQTLPPTGGKKKNHLRQSIRPKGIR